MLGIIAAMSEEMAFLHEAIDVAKQETMGDYTFVQGRLADKDIVLVQSGIGKVNAAVATTLLEQIYKPKAVINIGAAGGVEHNLQVGDVVLAKEMVYYDVDATAFDYNYGQVPQMPATFHSDKKLLQVASECLQDVLHLTVHQGLVVSGDSFVNDAAQISKIGQHFSDFYAVDMESCAIAQVCHRFHIPFLVVRAISDVIHADANEEMFKDNLQLAAKHSTDLLVAILQRIDHGR